jgi:hypothetical protein
MSSRSKQYLAKAEECQQYADAAGLPGTKRLYEEMASQWQRLAEQASRTDEAGTPPLLHEPTPR